MIAALEGTTMDGSCDNLIRCKRATCQQVLARVWADGGVEPVVTGAHADRDGRLVVVCPACQERNRLPIRRKAA